MLQDEIDRIRLTIEEAMVDAPASALLFKTGRVSLDELMQRAEQDGLLSSSPPAMAKRSPSPEGKSATVTQSN